MSSTKVTQIDKKKKNPEYPTSLKLGLVNYAAWAKCGLWSVLQSLQAKKSFYIFKGCKKKNKQEEHVTETVHGP